MSGTVRATGPADLIELLPYLLGFAPAESVVIVGLTGAQVMVVARVDLDEGEDAACIAMRQVLGHAEAALMVVYTERAAPQWVRQPSAALREALLVTGGRWYSLLCTNPDCCPAEGRELPAGPGVVAATAVTLGLAPAASRDEIAARLAPSTLTSEATEKAAQFSPIPGRDAAWLELDTLINDHDALHAKAASYLQVARHCPQDARAAGAWFLYAWAQWRLGDGARAAIALDYLDVAAPTCSAAELLRSALQMGIDPRRAPALTRAAREPGELGGPVSPMPNEGQVEAPRTTRPGGAA